MFVKGIVAEDFVNYRKPSMFIAFPKCHGFKCGKELCQNSPLALSRDIDVAYDKIINKYVSNPITKAIVFGGLEPLDTFEDVMALVKRFRFLTDDDIVIYTGFNKDEVLDKVEELKKYPNIIMKYGRFIPNDKSRYDEVLGVDLASQNQYAERIS